MDAYVMHVHNHTCTRYAHNVGMGAYMYAHVNMWARIMHAHARENSNNPYTESVEGYFATGLT